METTKIIPIQQDSALPYNTLANKVPYGNFNPVGGNKEALIISKLAMQQKELERLNDMKLYFVSAASEKLGKRPSIMDKVQASARAFSQYLKGEGAK